MTRPATTFLFVDDDPDKLLDIPQLLGLVPWAPVGGNLAGTVLPAIAIRTFATAVATRSPLPELVLIDDRVEFSDGARRADNGIRTMAAFTRLLDTFPRAGTVLPTAFVLLTHNDPSERERLTFMEFGGSGIADRQNRLRDVPDAIAAALESAAKRTIAWRPKVREPYLGPVHGSRDFWRDLFPLLPLLDDETDPALIKAHLRLSDGATDEREAQRQARVRLNDRKAALADQIGKGLTQRRGEPTEVESDDEIVDGADELGLLWIVEARRREASDLPWTELLPPEAKTAPIAGLRLRSDRDPAARAAWYRHKDDPRREHGASHYPPAE